MVRNTILGIALLLASAAGASAAPSHRVVGVVSAIEQATDPATGAAVATIRVTTDTGALVTINVNRRTRYLQVSSVVHQAYTKFTDLSQLAVGRCVDIQVPNEGATAQVVRYRTKAVAPCSPCSEL